MGEHEERGLERLIAFSDAVVAIAMTLLILPLTELKPEEGQGAYAFLVENQEDLVALLISFLVIAQFWFAHHRIFSQLERHDHPLLLLNTAWLGSIVLLPMPTALMNFDGGYTTFYAANLLATGALTFALGSYVETHPALTDSSHTISRRRRWLEGSALLGPMVLALVVSVFAEHAALWLLLLIIPANLVADRIEPDPHRHPRPTAAAPELTGAATEDGDRRSAAPDHRG